MTDQNVGPLPEPSTGDAQQAPLASTQLNETEDAQWAMLSHFLNIILVLPALIIFLMFKDRGQRVFTESREALNWTINVAGTVIILNFVNLIFGFIPFLGLVSWMLFTILIWAVLVINLVFAIIGGMKVKNGGSYRYPLNYRWIK